MDFNITGISFTADFSITIFTWAALRAGQYSRMNAASPATTGDAMLVPWRF
jgi:hypothetical protein